MIKNRTRSQEQAEYLDLIIKALQPVRHYKRLGMTDKVLKPLGFAVTRTQEHGGCTRLMGYLPDRSFLEVYEYARTCTGVQDLIQMLEANRDRLQKPYRPTVYTKGLCEFLTNAVGEEVECTPEGFSDRKAQTVQALMAALAWVQDLQDCTTPGRYDFMPDQD